MVVILFFAVNSGKYYPKRIVQTEKTLEIDDEKFSWENIDHITLKESEFGNQYVAFYFKDSTPPASFDMEWFKDKEDFVELLAERAAQNGFGFIQEMLEGEIRTERVIAPKKESKLFQEKEELEKEIDLEKEMGRKMQEERSKIKLSRIQKSAISVILVILFTFWIYTALGVKMTALIFMILLVHEGGHLCALKYFRMKVHGLFFIPLVGAGVVPKEEFPSPEAEAAVALAGPVAGLLWNLVAFLAIGIRWRFFLDSFLVVIPLNLVINVLNLMPILPLDGGRIVRAALLRGKRSLIPVTIITVGSGLVLAVYLKEIFFLVIALLGLASLVYSYNRVENREVSPPLWWKSAIMEQNPF